MKEELEYSRNIYMFFLGLAVIILILGHIPLPNLGELRTAFSINVASGLFSATLLFYFLERKLVIEKDRRANEKIHVILQTESGKKYKFPVPLKRSQFSRAEVLGILGMFPNAPTNPQNEEGKNEEGKNEGGKNEGGKNEGGKNEGGKNKEEKNKDGKKRFNLDYTSLNSKFLEEINTIIDGKGDAEICILCTAAGEEEQFDTEKMKDWLL